MCFFENVEGHISLGLSSVISDLEELGYKVSWGIFSAREVGAPHQRKRVFILAHRNGVRLQQYAAQPDRRHWEDLQEQPQGGCASELAYRHGERGQLPDWWREPAEQVPVGYGETWQSSLGTMAAWPTPNCMDVITPTRDLTQMESKGHWGKGMNTGKLSEMVNYGQAAPASSSSLGSRQGSSEPSQQNWQTFAHGTHNRGETPHRQVVRALVYGEKAKTQCLTVDQVFAEEIKGTNKRDWSTPTVAGRRTPNCGDAKAGMSTGRKQKSLGQDVTNWATPTNFCFQPPENTEQWTKRAEYQQTEKGVNLHKPIQSQVLHENEKVMGAMPPSSAKLNPRWVETLMGLPVGWTMPSCASPVTIELTSCDSSETESCQPQQNEHSES
jgi:site-specific DNA-cytosine methylase